MDKHLMVRLGAIAVMAILAIALFVLPGMFRVDMVVAMGVLSTNTLTMVLQGIGSLCGVVAAGLGINATRRAIIGKRAAAAKALEANTPYTLPAKSETRPEVIREHLTYVAKRHPRVADMVNESLEQLRLLKQHLDNIREIFRVNPGLLSQSDAQFESGKFEILLERVIEEACKDLLRIVYQASARKGDDEAPIEPLIDAIRQVNGKNQERVDLARELSDKAAQTATEVDGDIYVTTATEQVQQLIVRLDQTNRKQVF